MTLIIALLILLGISIWSAKNQRFGKFKLDLKNSIVHFYIPDHFDQTLHYKYQIDKIEKVETKISGGFMLLTVFIGNKTDDFHLPCSPDDPNFKHFLKILGPSKVTDTTSKLDWLTRL